MSAENTGVRTDILASTASLPARVAKLADARDLKSRVSKETYRFNSGPGHQDLMGLAICRTPGWLAYDTEIAKPESLS